MYSHKRNPAKQQFFIQGGMNKVIKFLTISDFILLSSFGLIAPIFAIFIGENIIGGDVRVVGISATIFLISKSIFQIPVAELIDKIKGERDDFWLMFTGSVVFSVIPLLYMVIEVPLQLYIVQALYGFASALTFPSWMSIFTKHIDRKHEGLEWGMYYTITDLGTAGAAAFGGFVVASMGFDVLFVTIAITSFIGSLFLLGVKSKLYKT